MQSQIDIVTYPTVHTDLKFTGFSNINMQGISVSGNGNIVSKSMYFYNISNIVTINDCQFNKIRMVCYDSDCYVTNSQFTQYLGIETFTNDMLNYDVTRVGVISMICSAKLTENHKLILKESSIVDSGVVAVYVNECIGVKIGPNVAFIGNNDTTFINQFCGV